MRWATRTQPHVDRCASAWLIKRFIDPEAQFLFIERHDPIPEGAVAFTLPTAEVKPVEGVSTTYDALMERYRVVDPAARTIGELIYDFEIDAAEDLARVRRPESAGIALILRGLSKVSTSDEQTIERATIMLDALASELREMPEAGR
jgi:hypothetical protein